MLAVCGCRCVVLREEEKCCCSSSSPGGDSCAQTEAIGVRVRRLTREQRRWRLREAGGLYATSTGARDVARAQPVAVGTGQGGGLRQTQVAPRSGAVRACSPNSSWVGESGESGVCGVCACTQSPARHHYRQNSREMRAGPAPQHPRPADAAAVAEAAVFSAPLAAEWQPPAGCLAHPAPTRATIAAAAAAAAAWRCT